MTCSILALLLVCFLYAVTWPIRSSLAMDETGVFFELHQAVNVTSVHMKLSPVIKYLCTTNLEWRHLTYWTSFQIFWNSFLFRYKYFFTFLLENSASSDSILILIKYFLKDLNFSNFYLELWPLLFLLKDPPYLSNCNHFIFLKLTCDQGSWCFSPTPTNPPTQTLCCCCSPHLFYSQTLSFTFSNSVCVRFPRFHKLKLIYFLVEFCFYFSLTSRQL